jgi:hypothetical protein
MAANSYNDILKRVQEELSAEERLRLADELSGGADIVNGCQLGGSLFDALNARGLIGFMKDGPGDLSTNPKHLEGFGQHGE